MRPIRQNGSPKRLTTFVNNISVARHRGRWINDNTGATAVEFGLIAVPLILVVVGGVQVTINYLTATSLDLATARVAKMVKTGQVGQSTYNAAGIVAQLCKSITFPIGDCSQRMYVNVQTFNTYASIQVPPPVVGGKPNTSSFTVSPLSSGQIVAFSAYYQNASFTPIRFSNQSTLDTGDYFTSSTVVFRAE